MNDEQTTIIEAHCQDCRNDAEDAEFGWFIQNDRTGSWMCTKCGSYDVATREVPGEPRPRY
jgi:hypothetical protein